MKVPSAIPRRWSTGVRHKSGGVKLGIDPDGIEKNKHRPDRLDEQRDRVPYKPQCVVVGHVA